MKLLSETIEKILSTKKNWYASDLEYTAANMHKASASEIALDLMISSHKVRCMITAIRQAHGEEDIEHLVHVHVPSDMYHQLMENKRKTGTPVRQFILKSTKKCLDSTTL